MNNTNCFGIGTVAQVAEAKSVPAESNGSGFDTHTDRHGDEVFLYKVKIRVLDQCL